MPNSSAPYRSQRTRLPCSSPSSLRPPHRGFRWRSSTARLRCTPGRGPHTRPTPAAPRPRRRGRRRGGWRRRAAWTRQTCAASSRRCCSSCRGRRAQRPWRREGGGGRAATGSYGAAAKARIDARDAGGPDPGVGREGERAGPGDAARVERRDPVEDARRERRRKAREVQDGVVEEGGDVAARRGILADRRRGRVEERVVCYPKLDADNRRQ